MTFKKKIDNYLLDNNKTNLKQLAIDSSIAYTTLREMYNRGIDNSRLGIAKKLAEHMGCTLDYLAYDEVVDFKGNLVYLNSLNSDNKIDETDILYDKYREYLPSKDKTIIKAIIEETKKEIDDETE